MLHDPRHTAARGAGQGKPVPITGIRSRGHSLICPADVFSRKREKISYYKLGFSCLRETVARHAPDEGLSTNITA